mmetsp:Transcript_53321/g.134282  ORF Transcript_53321/g.134282 Transcript_53321/m.134282 type:complete len:213 (+) Transcript_53321:242-880(+)
MSLADSLAVDLLIVERNIAGAFACDGMMDLYRFTFLCDACGHVYVCVCKRLTHSRRHVVNQGSSSSVSKSLCVCLPGGGTVSIGSIRAHEQLTCLNVPGYPHTPHTTPTRPLAHATDIKKTSLSSDPSIHPPMVRTCIGQSNEGQMAALSHRRRCDEEVIPCPPSCPFPFPLRSPFLCPPLRRKCSGGPSSPGTPPQTPHLRCLRLGFFRTN